MRLIETRVEQADGGVRLVGVVETRAGARHEVYFHYEAELASFVTDSADAFVPSLLVPCMEHGEDLEVVPPISPRLARNIERAQDIFLCWHASFRRARVSVQERDAPLHAPAAGVGALFSGGVDSFYTLLKSIKRLRLDTPPVTHLVFLRGLETPLEEARGVDAAQANVEEVAREAGVRLIVGRSNVRTCFPSNYELYYHGAALASAALALSGGLRCLLIPSSVSYAQLQPWGSDPLLDPLWSTEALDVIHDGCEARRVDKLESLVGGDPLALRYLRVCLENAGGAYNCGRCRKCVRTMIALELLGTLPQARLFPDRVPDEALRLLGADYEDQVAELLDLATRTGRSPRLENVLKRALARRRRRSALRTLARETPIVATLLPWVDRTRARLRRVFRG
jgi:hypothetical protein